MKRSFLVVLLGFSAKANADPQLTSWFTSNSGQYARVYQSTASETAGVKSTTWSRGAGTQSLPAYADVNEISYSASWVYIKTTGLASHVMGPWPTSFPNFPSNTATTYRIPRAPTVPTNKTATGGGPIGRFVNGVSFFDNRDAFSYVFGGTETNPGSGIWNRDAYVNESVTFDPALAHQAGNNYHYHVHPIALRYQLGDHVAYNATTNRYTEATTAPAHSPIIAWAADGNPVYGPYGYSDPTAATSGVRRMVSGFTPRNGSFNTANITSAGRHTLPVWAAAAQGRFVALTSTEYGPDVSSSYPFGRYLEDNDFLGDLGYTQTIGATSRDFDLDKYNGRTCVTPEFPTPHYCYFTTINADGSPAFPYNIGRQFYGNPTGGSTTITEAVTSYFLGGANTPIVVNTPIVSSGTVTLAWSTVEGGTYSIDASSDQSSWTSKKTALVADGISKSSSYTALGSSGTEYGRVNRTALASYDAAGQTAATTAQSIITSYVATGGSGTPPTIASISTNPSAPTNADAVVVSATITPQLGCTLTAAQLTYNTGSGTTTVFNETMASVASDSWTGINAVYPWTLSFAGPPTTPFSQTAADNHTASGQGNQFAMEIDAHSPNLADSVMTTTNSINAVGTSASIEFYIATANLTGTMGWDFQTSTDGITWTTRLSELSGLNQAYTRRIQAASAIGGGAAKMSFGVA